MNRTYIVLFLSLAVIALLIYQSQGLKRTYQSQVSERLHPLNPSLVTEEDLQPLPLPLQKYLTYAGVVGKEKTHNFRLVFEGEMKLDPTKDWVHVVSEQHNFFDPSARFFYIHAKMAGIPFMGLHSYDDAGAVMLIKVLGLWSVVNARGPIMDTSETVTVFNDMCLYAPATLIDPTIHWETVDYLTVKGTFTLRGHTISALLYFNEQGQLINFVSNDRFMTGLDNKPIQLPWSTPITEYIEVDGRRVPDNAIAIWHTPEGDYPYAKFRVKEIEYNRQ